MKKNIVKMKILIPMVCITLICGMSVLLSSIFAYNDKVHSSIYERADNRKDGMLIEFSNIEEHARDTVIRLAGRADLIAAIETGDNEAIIAITEYVIGSNHYRVKSQGQNFPLNYGFITDGDGNVLYRPQEPEYLGGNISTKPQMKLALEGETNNSLVRGERETLVISAATPVYNENNDIIGVVVLGINLDNRIFLRALTEDFEATIFADQTNISSTLNVPPLNYLPEETQAEIIQNVLKDGGVFEGELTFVNQGINSKVYPIRGINDEILGMLLVGIASNIASGEVFAFVLQGSLITLVLFVIAIFVSFYVSGKIEKQFSSMIREMTHRDKLLEAVNHASVILLEIDETDEIRAPLISGMELIGAAMSVDHVHLWQGRVDESDTTQFVREYSWVSDYAKTRSKAPKYITSSQDSSKLDWMEKFQKGEYISGVISNMPPSYQELLKPLNTKSITMVPLFLENQFWGMFSIDNINKEMVLNEDEITILRSISLMMANIVRRHALQNENLKVYFDALTGIHNRRFFDKTMKRVISSLSRAGGTLSVMMIDVDYFKKYNDTYGHGAGDECLIKVAEVLSSSVLRVDDFVARYGGEEFVAVMPNTDEAGAVAVAEKMLEGIRDAKIPHKASEVSDCVSFSIGLTSGTVTQHHTTDSFVQRADEMLYKSKADGRNRYTFGDIT